MPCLTKLNMTAGMILHIVPCCDVTYTSGRMFDVSGNCSVMIFEFELERSHKTYPLKSSSNIKERQEGGCHHSCEVSQIQNHHTNQRAQDKITETQSLQAVSRNLVSAGILFQITVLMDRRAELPGQLW